MIAASEAHAITPSFVAHAVTLTDAFDQVRGPLERALRSLLGSREDAEDALQMAFLRCWQARAALPQIRNVRAWVWRIGLNVGRDLLDYTRRRRYKSLSRIESTAACQALSPVDDLAIQEDEDRLCEALHSLRAEEKQVFLMRQNKALTYEEIARLRGSPVGSVKTLMHGAVRKLRGMLQESTN
jgi:RNA polymerase sigma-70 factor (ECF subfamily)